jgi:hypothetical protein
VGGVRTVSMTLRTAFVTACLAVCLHSAAVAGSRPTGVVEACSDQSQARFPRAFTARDNLVVGPLVLIGAGRLTTPDTVRRFGGNKFPLLVLAGQRVTIELTRRTRRFASLGYGPLPQGRELTVRDGHRVVTFRACTPGRALSDADGRPVTFWSGFVLARRPHCVPLRVWVGAETTPRHARIPLGRRCR